MTDDYEPHPGPGQYLGYTTPDTVGDAARAGLRCLHCHDPGARPWDGLYALPAGAECVACGRVVVRDSDRYGWLSLCNLEVMADAVTQAQKDDDDDQKDL